MQFVFKRKYHVFSKAMTGNSKVTVLAKWVQKFHYLKPCQSNSLICVLGTNENLISLLLRGSINICYYKICTILPVGFVEPQQQSHLQVFHHSSHDKKTLRITFFSPLNKLKLSNQRSRLPNAPGERNAKGVITVMQWLYSERHVSAHAHVCRWYYADFQSTPYIRLAKHIFHTRHVYKQIQRRSAYPVWMKTHRVHGTNSLTHEPIMMSNRTDAI